MFILILIFTVQKENVTQVTTKKETKFDIGSPYLPEKQKSKPNSSNRNVINYFIRAPQQK